jgi:WD40 repeat protein
MLLFALAFFLTTQVYRPVQYEIHPDESVYGLAFSPDGKTLALGGDLKVRLWDVASRKEVARLEGHTGRVFCVAFRPDGKLLASGSDDHTVRLWDMPSGKEASILQGHSGKVVCLAFSPNGKVLASGGHANPILRLWDVGRGKQKPHPKLWVEGGGKRYDLEEHGQGAVTGLAFSPNGKTLACAKTGGPVILWDVATGKGTIFPEGPSADFDCVAFSRDGKLLAAGSRFRQLVQLWEVATSREVATCAGEGLHVAFSPDGKTLAASDARVKLWDVETATERADFGHEQKSLLGGGHRSCIITCMALSPDGQTLVTGGYNGTIMFWDVAAVVQKK